MINIFIKLFNRLNTEDKITLLAALHGNHLDTAIDFLFNSNQS